jgi:hypothetical protein
MGDTAVPNHREFALEHGRMRNCPCLGLSPVLARAPEVECDDKDEEWKNECLLPEIAGARPLPNAIPLGKGSVGTSGYGSVWRKSGRCQRDRHWVRGTGKIGEICIAIGY